MTTDAHISGPRWAPPRPASTALHSDEALAGPGARETSAPSRPSTGATAITKAALADARGRDKVIAVLNGLLTKGVPGGAKVGIGRAIVPLSTDRTDEVTAEAEAAASAEVSAASAVTLAIMIDVTLRGQLGATALLTALKGRLPTAAAKGLDRALAAIAAEQQKASEAIDAAAPRRAASGHLSRLGLQRQDRGARIDTFGLIDRWERGEPCRPGHPAGARDRLDLSACGLIDSMEVVVSDGCIQLSMRSAGHRRRALRSARRLFAEVWYDALGEQPDESWSVELNHFR